MPSYVMFLLRKMKTILLSVNLFKRNVIRMFLKTIFDKNINIILQIKAKRYKKISDQRSKKNNAVYKNRIFLCLAYSSYVMDCTRAA